MTPSGQYSLIDQAWLPVHASGETLSVSLAEIFRSAHLYDGLAGDSPTQAGSLLRLLLAVVRRAHPHARTPKDWESLWRRGLFDVEMAIWPYLDKHRERFWLFHTEAPFMQVGGLRSASGELSEVARLLPDVPSKFQFFTTRAGKHVSSVSFAEAARWLVHTQAYDVSGIKTGAVGDNRVKGGKGYPIGIGWCGWLGLVIVEGRNLFETLMLNLQLGSGLPDPEIDLPVWERAPLGPGLEEGHEHPAGPVDLFTWPSRRIRLGHDGERVTGVLIANGDPLHPRNRFRQEPMTAWRYSEPQTTATRSPDPVFMPRIPAPDRAVWRGMEALLVPKRDDALVMPGRWLTWLEEVEEAGALDPSHPVRLRVVAAQYGPKSSSVEDVTDDALLLPAAVLTSRALTAAAVDAVTAVDSVATLVGRLAGDLVLAAGGDRDLAGHDRSEAREQLYAALDSPYRRWVEGLSPDEVADLVGWQRQVRATALRQARIRLDAAGPTAWTGLPAGPGRKQPLNAATAANWFYVNLRRALPDAAPATRSEGAPA